MSGLDVGALLDEYDADTRPVKVKREPVDDDYRSGRELVDRPSRLSGVLDREREDSPAVEGRNANGRDYSRSGILGESPRQNGSPKVKTEDAHDDDRQYRDRSDRDGDRRRRDRNSSSVEASSRRSPGGEGRRGSGDYYRGDGRSRRRSRSPGRSNRGRRDYDDRDRGDRYRDRDSRGDRDSYRGGRDRERRERRRTPSPRRARTPEPTEDERDRRTVFVQQLAARLRTKDLIQFFEKVGPVKEAQIVKDRVSGRSKGVGYVEFKEEASVQAAIQLTGQKLLGIPIIAQLTEAEKNRQARTTETVSSGNANSVPFHRLYVGNIHFSITETDLQNIFEPFGELEFVQLQKEDTGRSRGYGFVQFIDAIQAKEALEKMNGFELAGRPIRVGLGNDKFTPESTANLLQRFQGQSQQFQGSSFSGHGGRGAYAGGQGGTFDRAGGRDDQKGAGGASALDDTDVAGVNFNNYSRDSLMKKLAGISEPSKDATPMAKPSTVVKKPLPMDLPQASRCVVLKNAFDPANEVGESWIKELEDDIRAECEEKFGHVVHIKLDPNTIGDVYIKFDRVQGGENAIKGLNGRWFGGRTITAQPVVDAVYSSLFSRTKAI